MGGLPLPENTPKEIETARIYRRFYTAFQLRDLCNEIPIHVVARKYDIPRGLVQNLAQTCEGFAAGMIKFCERMQWGMLQIVLEHMRDRLKAGARADLLELAKIPFIKSRTARLFWENGMKSLRAVAAAEVKDIVPILVLVWSVVKVESKTLLITLPGTAEEVEDQRRRRSSISPKTCGEGRNHCISGQSVMG